MAKPRYGMVRLPTTLIDELKAAKEQHGTANSLADVIAAHLDASDGNAELRAQHYLAAAASCLVEGARRLAPLVVLADAPTARLTPATAWERMDADQRRHLITQVLPDHLFDDGVLIREAYRAGDCLEGAPRRKPGVRYRAATVSINEGENQ